MRLVSSTCRDNQVLAIVLTRLLLHILAVKSYEFVILLELLLNNSTRTIKPCYGAI